MSTSLEIRIAEVSLVAKLDAIGAALAAVREAHRAEISPEAWSAVNRAQRAIAEAMTAAIRREHLPLNQGGQHAAGEVIGLSHAESLAPVPSGRRAGWKL